MEVFEPEAIDILLDDLIQSQLKLQNHGQTDETDKLIATLLDLRTNKQDLRVSEVLHLSYKTCHWIHDNFRENGSHAEMKTGIDRLILYLRDLERWRRIHAGNAKVDEVFAQVMEQLVRLRLYILIPGVTPRSIAQWSYYEACNWHGIGSSRWNNPILVDEARVLGWSWSLRLLTAKVNAEALNNDLNTQTLASICHKDVHYKPPSAWIPHLVEGYLRHFKPDATTLLTRVRDVFQNC
jgi:hypothetical protein